MREAISATQQRIDPRTLGGAGDRRHPGREPRRQRQRRRAAAGLALISVYVALASVIWLSLGATSAAKRKSPRAAAAAHRAGRLAFRVHDPRPRGPGDAAGSRTEMTADELAGALPFPPDRSDRGPRSQEIVSMYADGRWCSIGCRPYGAVDGWPLAPFHHQHPLRAGLNELRPGSLHVGVDIQARDGANVYAVQPGYARVLSGSGPNARVQVGNYVYWHVNPRVQPGEYVIPFVTVLGTVMSGYGHIAFSELGALGEYVNPLRPIGGVLRPFVDHARPVIGAPALAADGQVVVSAYDRQTFVRRTTYITPVLAPAALAYRLYDRHGVPVTPLEWAFRGTHLISFSERELIYTPAAHAPGYGCFATRPVCVPTWSYRLAGGLAPQLSRWLAPGRYRLSIYAWDWADNETARDSTVTLTARGWKMVGRFPSAVLAMTGSSPYASGYSPG